RQLAALAAGRGGARAARRRAAAGPPVRLPGAESHRRYAGGLAGQSPPLAAGEVRAALPGPGPRGGVGALPSAHAADGAARPLPRWAAPAAPADRRQRGAPADPEDTRLRRRLRRAPQRAGA